MYRLQTFLIVSFIIGLVLSISIAEETQTISTNIPSLKGK